MSVVLPPVPEITCRPESEWKEKEISPFFRTVNPAAVIIGRWSEWSVWDDFRVACWELPTEELYGLCKDLEILRVQKICKRFEERGWLTWKAKWVLAHDFTKHYRASDVVAYLHLQ